MRAQLIELVAATLGRAPSPEELTNWLADLEGGTELSAIAEEIMFDLGGVGRIAGVNNTAILVNAYQNLFGRLPDNTGLNYWLNEMNAGRVDLGNLIPSLLAGARAETGNSNDALVINGRLLAATQYLDGLDGDDNYSASAAAAAVSAVTRGSVADSAEEPSDLYDPNDQGDGGDDNGDDNSFTLQQALAATDLPDTYTISDIATVHAAATIADVTDANTMTVIAGAENSADYVYSLSDTVANLVDAGAANTVDGAVNVTATDAATVAQGDILVAAANTGTTTYNLNDTAAALAAAGGTLNSATNVTASDAANLAQAETIADATNTGTTTYSVEGTSANLITAAQDASAANKNGLNDAATITATDLNEVVTFDQLGADAAATRIAFFDGETTLSAADYNTLTGSIDTSGGDNIIVDTMNGAAVTGNGANDTFALLSSDTGVTVNSFVSAQDTVALGGVAGAVAAIALSVAGQDGSETLVLDTAAALGASAMNIGGASNANWAVASDTGTVYYDADGDWTGGVVTVGTVNADTLVAADFTIA
ncbi:DUF4214 domain-containing protein [Marinobacter sp. CA1]|uniref:DUF4214 domain-containing protein n=1 Tax=Marinobacter sp. CA1 TaxID=2817656 RepID=UPI001D05CC24|nr:DUF4214 domain-containing protein [Marinobacter sp. CA1]UDL03830.1 DUF4214 domain-containing protein [Marinobacter sp. CA1]